MQHDWTRVVADLGPRLFRYFRTRFAHEEAADLTQETLLRLVRKHRRGEFDPERGNLAMYAFGIAYYVRLEATKARPTAESSILVDVEVGFDDALERNAQDKQTAEDLRRAIASLPAEQAEIMSLMIDQDLSLNDVATLTNLPLGTVKSHVFRAKDRLRRLLLERKTP